MNRRQFFQRAGVLGAIGLAGCVSGGNPDPENASGGDGGANSPAGSGVSSPVISDSTVETTDSSCASEELQHADIAIDADSEAVTFSGWLHAPTPCHEVSIASASYDEGSNSLTVTLETERTDEVCVECIGEIVFEGRVSFDGGVPEDVTVSHGDTVLGSTKYGVGTPTPDGSPTLVGDSFEVLSIGPGAESGDTDIAFETDENEVVVTGTILGSDGCTTAALGNASYDAGADALSVDVVTRREEGSEDAVCTQEVVAVAYEARFAFEGGLPREVSVSHDGRGIASAAHGRASAGGPEDS